MTSTIYIHQPEKAFSFTRLPNFLFETPTFQPLSNEAKLLYAFILRRAELSRKNGWADEYGRIYLYYPICEVVELLHCGRQKAVNTLRELQYAELIEIKKQGCGKPTGKEWNGERSRMAQHAILRFEKHKGNPARPLEAHHERQKEQYASNPDIDTSRSKYNFHIVKPEGRYYHFIQRRIEQAGCRTRKDSARFVDTLITASPEFFKEKSPKEIQAFFQRAVSLSRQARAIEAALDGINPLNAGKKKEEALSLLKKWFPQMENFSGQLKKYKVTIKDLLAENEKLEARAKASESGKIKDRMERAKLKSELDNMQRLIDRIPPEVLAELKRQQRHTTKER